MVAGRLTACEWARKACRRQLADLERGRTDPSWPYEFNPRPEPAKGRRPLPGPADRICLFVEALPHIKGDWAGRRENLTLSPWQVFVLTTVFGWGYKPGSIDPGYGRDLGG